MIQLIKVCTDSACKYNEPSMSVLCLDMSGVFVFKYVNSSVSTRNSVVKNSFWNLLIEYTVGHRQSLFVWTWLALPKIKMRIYHLFQLEIL